jgi:hypothetical protein
MWGAKLNTGRRDTWNELSNKLVAFGKTHSHSMDDQVGLAEIVWPFAIKDSKLLEKII